MFRPAGLPCAGVGYPAASHVAAAQAGVDPEAGAEACAGIGFRLGTKEQVLSQLCGALWTDYSVASATGLMNMHTLEWGEEVLLTAGVQPEPLPEFVPTTHILPSSTDDAAAFMRLPVTTPVVVGAADGPLANLGVRAVGPGPAACSVGTSGAMRVAVERPAVDPLGGVFCYALTSTRWGGWCNQ